MSDKSRSLFPVSITFTSGEIPTPEKLSAIGIQARRGLNIAEYILGDVWNQGGDSFLQAAGTTTYALMIPNIARFLGKSNNLNPMVPYTTSITSYNHLVSASDVSNRELILSLPPTALTSFTWAGTSAPSGSPQTDVGNVNASGRWYVDRDTGWCYFYDAIQSDWNVTYIPQVEGDLGSDATWNVIPDISQEASYAFGGCKIAYKNGTDNSAGYMIYLPPRGPLDSDRLIDRSPQSQYDISGNTENESSTPDALPVKFFQSGSVAGTTGSYAEHYRYSLPKIITDNYSNGATLPDGMLYLWDHSQTGTILEGLTFRAEDVASPRSYVLIVSGTALNSWVTNYFSTAYPSANLTHVGDTSAYHTSAYYPSAGLKLIVIGSDITATLSNLIKMFYNHDHGSANSLPGNCVKHTKLSETFSPIVSQASASLRIPSSVWGYDNHSQYLHRLGYNTSHSSDRDINKGGMLGDILMCSSSSTSNYLNLSANSRLVRFGSVTAASPYVYFAYDDGNSDSMDSLHLHYKKISVGSYQGAAVEFRDPSTDTWTYGLAARIHHTNGTTPLLSVERCDKTAGNGEGASFEANRFYSGGMDESTYGYSGTDASAGWGRTRSYVISPTDWRVLVLSTSGTYVSTQRQPTTEYLIHTAATPTLPILSLPQESSGTQTVAFHHLRIPDGQVAIVNMSLAMRVIGAGSISNSNFTLSIIRQEVGRASGGSLYSGGGGTSVLWDTNPIFEITGNLFLASGSNWVSGRIQSPTGTASDLKALVYLDLEDEVPVYDYNNSYVVRILLTGVALANAAMYIAPIQIVYRIKEF